MDVVWYVNSSNFPSEFQHKLVQRIAKATTTKKCYGPASSQFRVASEGASGRRSRVGRRKRRALLFFSPHLALACHLRMTTLRIDMFYCHHFTRIFKLHFKFGVFQNSCGRNV